MKNIKYIFVILLTTTLYSCKEFMEPFRELYDRDYEILENGNYFKGLLYNTFNSLPNRPNFVFEAATDNAVTNNDNTAASRAARGGISFISNPLDDITQNGVSNGTLWLYNYYNINIVNFILERLVWDDSKKPPTPVIFEFEEEANREWFYLLMGDAYFARAWFQFDLLQKYGGVAADGVAYGFPIVTNYLTVKDDLDRPRNTYIDCVNQIVADCDEAIKLMPFDYTVTGVPIWDGGNLGFGHASGKSAMALKARVLLYAASPAFNTQNDAERWRRAAQACRELIDKTGFNDLLSLTSYFTNHVNTTGVNTASYNADLFFRGPVTSNTRNLETENFPPRASGSATYQPSQNLVDAFPMCDGYPISSTSADYPYDVNDMYENRDPRLSAFIIYNGQPATYGIENPNPATYQTTTGGRDAFGYDQNSTRTGYYLKKWLNGSVRNTGNLRTTNYTTIVFGRPELYLSFAEAAIQATGDPDDKTYGYSAREVLAKVRDRAFGEGKDKYLPTVTGKDAFLNVVKNERRVELCFEGHRFWDMRRWSTGKGDVTAINAPVYGIYSSSPVETRSYKSPYMPLPYGEMLKTKNLVNNDGW